MELIVVGLLAFVVILRMRHMRARDRERDRQPTPLAELVGDAVVLERRSSAQAPRMAAPELFLLGTSGRAGQPCDAPFAVVDIETTGFHPFTDRVVEVAVVNMTRQGRIVGEWSTVLNGDGASGGSDIHGLPPSKRRSAPGFADVVDEFLAHLSGHIVVAHNAIFEDRFLRAELDRAGRAVAQMPALCSLILARRALPELPGYKLEQCCASVGVELKDPHTALGDARALAGLLPHLLDRTESPRYQIEPVVFGPARTTSAVPRLTN